MSKGSGGIIIREEWNNTLVNMSISEKGIFLDSLLKHVDGDVISDIPEKCITLLNPLVIPSIWIGQSIKK